MATDADRAAMRRAVALAARGRGRVHPNPVVGAVILDEAGAVVGEGWHARDADGSPHAEVVALAQAGDRARGGTAVVTLEPCAHQGRTGPCVEALVAAGVRRVVVGVPEPTDRASGGAARLRAAGIDVVEEVEQDLAARVNEAWLTSVALGRPFVTLKLAVTLDGRAAAGDGSSQWITGEAARADAHRLRAECDAVVVGVGTVLSDDPHLTVRHRAVGEDGHVHDGSPMRVVLDSDLRTPPTARVLDDVAPTWLMVADDRLPSADPRQVPTPRAAGGLNLHAVLETLHAHGALHLLVEGGPRVAASFVDADLVDRVVVYVAPAVMGSGRPGVDGGAGTPTISALARLRLDDVRAVGDDVRIEARRPRAGAVRSA